MKRINVLAYEKALVFKNGKLINILDAGSHWIGFGREAKIYDITELFYHETELDLLLKNEQFKNSVDVMIVQDHEINENIDRKVLKNSKLSPYYTSYFVNSNEKGILYVDGVLKKILSSGMYYFWKGDKLTTVKTVDMRKQQLEISGQELLTKDKAGIRVNFYANYKINDILKAIDETKDYARLLYINIQLGIREYVGQYTLDSLLANKESASTYIMEFAKEKAKEMGIELTDCGMRDIILPGDMRDIMNQVLIAEKKAQAQVIMRREETASTRSLLNTAKLMENNEMLFRLKEMEYTEKIADKINGISLSGGGQVLEQLRDIFVPQKG